MDVLMLSWMKGDAEVGFYSAAFRLILPLSFIPVALVVSLLPVMSRLYHEKDEVLSRVYQFSLKIMFCLSLPIAVLIYTASEQIIDIIYTSEYSQSTAGLKILIISQIFLFLNVVMNHFIISIGKQLKGLYVVGVMVIINFILNIFLIPKYGLVGASVATVVTEFSALILWINFTKGFLRDFPLLSLLKIIALNVIGIIFIGLMVEKYFFLSIIGFLIIQFLFILAFKIFSREEISEFKVSLR